MEKLHDLCDLHSEIKTKASINDLAFRDVSKKGLREEALLDLII